MKPALKILSIILLLICVIPLEAKLQKENVTYKGKLNDGKEWSYFVPKKISKKGYNAFGIIIGDKRVIFDKNETSSFMGLDYHWKLVVCSIDSHYVGDDPYFIVKMIRRYKNSNRTVRVSGIYDITGKKLYHSSDSKETKELNWRTDISNYTIGRAKFLFIQDDLSQNKKKYYSYDGEYIGTKIEENYVYESPQIKFLKVYSGSDTYYGYMTYDGKWLAKPIAQGSFDDLMKNQLSIFKFDGNGGNGRYYVKHQKMGEAKNSPFYFSWIDLETGEVFIPLSKHIYHISRIGKSGLFEVLSEDGEGIIDGNGREIVPIGQYTKISPYEFNDRLIEVKDKKGYRGVLDSLGNFLIPIGKYIKIEALKEVPNIYKTWKDYRYGLIDNNCKEILPCIFESLEYVSTGGNDVGAFKVVLNNYKYKGYYSTNGRCLIQPTNELVDRISLKYSHKIIYEISENGCHRIVDENGRILSPEGMHAGILYDEFHKKEYMFFKEVINGVADQRMGLMDVDGSILIPLERGYYHIEPFDYKENALFLVGDKDWNFKHLGIPYGGHWGLIDVSCKELIAPNKYQILEIIYNTSLIKVSDNRYREKYGICTIQGKEIMPIGYDDIQYAGNNCIKFKQNGFWGLATTQGKVIIPISRCYKSLSNYNSDKKTFAFTKEGYKGECNNVGKQVSITKIPSPSTNTIAKSSSSNSTKSRASQQPIGLLYKGYYTSGDGVDTQTGMVMAGVSITSEIEIYEDHLQVGYMYAEYKRTNSSGTRVYECNSDGFGNPVTFYVTSSFDITEITDYYSYGFHNQVRTPYSKGETTYSPTMNGNYGNSYNSSPNQSTNGYNSNPGLSAAQYQQNYNGYERIAEGIFRSFQINPDMNYGPRTQNMRTLRDAQNNMRRIRQEAASHGITIQQSSYETASPSY